MSSKHILYATRQREGVDVKADQTHSDLQRIVRRLYLAARTLVMTQLPLRLFFVHRPTKTECLRELDPVDD